ncbi:50S ribosomal protein L28 [Rickettsiales endosymbiont of Stachyamoeba lipophora]|uniref:50S ribosomal protein L28 n=1 Tax=Rickettsiales endosymbiont of Stachyamoeba lipophora TaxID=2486578 RepID=UPI000F65049F|nr:50S ribosomal protein L28 [Rickettsiales endosymbiont of Stachyamoeba lipophora]AZL15534.1 50S ribosomal protein L28 [Rickettsiales endosymbiont of Stachyamoeba lipophora]
MARRCDLTGKDVLTGNLVSHSNRKTRTRFLPNIKAFRLISDVLKQEFRFDLCVSTIRTIDAKGGFDNFLLHTANSKLTAAAQKIKKAILKAQATEATA